MTDHVVPPFFEPLGDQLWRRPPPSARGAIAAVGGLLAALGIVVATQGDDADVSRGVLAASGLGVGALAYISVLAVPRLWVREAGIAAASLAVAVVAAAIVDLDDASFTTFALVATAGWTGLYVAPGTRGRPVPLGLALLGLWFLLIDATTDGIVEFDSDAGTSAAIDAAAVSMLFGVAALAIGHAYDRRGWHGMLATPFFAVGNVAFWAGLAGVLADIGNGAAAAALAVLAGASIAFVGSHGADRRFTTWTGALGVGVGTSALVGEVLGDEASAVKGGLLIFAAGVALILAAALLVAPTTPAGSTTADSPAAGWYPDPGGGPGFRWWDGSAWTDHTADQAGDPPD
ncbi:MAG: DUF2510 domain-containing protein [Acidimicrobiia bacterium]|nr:DUF2510 domain-containing protein [Acidimicrobiia bacterium]